MCIIALMFCFRCEWQCIYIIISCCLLLLCLSWDTFNNLHVRGFLNKDLIDTKSTAKDVDAYKIKKVSFLKIHKCGSSTVACIFIRFGLNNNLSMYLPKKPEISDREQKALMERNEKYDMFLIHTNYSYRFFSTIVEDPEIITVIRRPEDRLISHSFFFNLNEKFKNLKGLDRQNVMNEILKDTEKYHVNNIIPTFFGIKTSNISDSLIYDYLMKLNSEFSLVLILERLNESLILLKRLLNWSVFDIIYVPKKRRDNNDIYLSESQITHLEYTNKLEYLIYNFFYKELEKKIDNAEDGFEHEVAHFENIIEKTNAFCNSHPKTLLFYTFAASRWDDSFNITRRDCDLLYQHDVHHLKSVYRSLYS